MTALQPGERAPDFTALAHNGQRLRLADYQGRNIVVLYFYPMDGTPVCTAQACGFRDAYHELTELGAVVIGVSADSQDRHRAFAGSRELPFLLLSDADGSLRKAYQVPKPLGILPGRVTFVIDKQGIIRHVFAALFSGHRHVAAALRIVRQLAQEPPISSAAGQ